MTLHRLESPVPIYGHIDERAASLFKGEINQITRQDKAGNWWQKQLYITRQVAQIRVNFDADPTAALENSAKPRDRLRATLDERLSSFETWRFSKALLLGDNNLWSERDTWIVRTLGLAHLFVVSGLHTGFMFVIGRSISWLVWQSLPARLVLSGVTRWHCDGILVIPLLLGYAYVTGWGEPVVRAGIMLSVYMLARMLSLKVSPHRIISFALWLVLLVEPRSILSPGLWLSFSMVYLLVGYCQTSIKWTRLLMAQVMLSTASMVLILGWQEAISSASVLVNIVLIPLAAFVWFPVGIVSCLEVLLVSTSYVYMGLDWVLGFVVLGLEWAVFRLPLLFYTAFSTDVPRWIMLLLVLGWVYQSPLKRGVLSAAVIWLVIFLPSFFQHSRADLSLSNQQGQFVFRAQDSIALNASWAKEDMASLLLNPYFPHLHSDVLMMSPNRLADVSPQWLLSHDVAWILLQKPSPHVELFDALKVNWLIVDEEERLSFFFQNDGVVLQHSACVYSFFLFKSDTCKRVEKLESVLNYQQI
ncbi:ComEC/Rec2 family competence protein [Marinomonas sp. A79]|uniref:ComEC/Rec2 family competence protein n=1 Tax=Marinomonas vulgaris TaxID=2823372 RepID=A0ABS5HAT8_9GAMM|nr:ComEC/Rec2 family competence protein [Marinomonas vulgaris]MBR7888513.1 ComEC/Rec2 family competence protein [Marinomonas vulgaris]